MGLAEWFQSTFRPYAKHKKEVRHIKESVLDAKESALKDALVEADIERSEAVNKLISAARASREMASYADMLEELADDIHKRERAAWHGRKAGKRSSET